MDEAMPLDATTLTSLVQGVASDAEMEWQRLKKFKSYFDGNHDKPTFSAEAERAYGKLWAASTVNQMPLAVQTVTQRLAVEGYKASNYDVENLAPWGLWQASNLDAEQVRLYESVGIYGYAYVSCLPAIGPTTPAPVRIRPWSPRRGLSQSMKHAMTNTLHWPIRY